MKKYISFSLALLMGLSLMGCGNTSESVSTEVQSTETTEKTVKLEVATSSGWESEWSDEFHLKISEAQYPILALSEESREDFSALADRIETMNEEKKTKQLQEYESFLEQAKEQLAEEGSDFYGYIFKEETKVRRADDKVLSLLFSGTSYAGGAHGDYYQWGENYNSQTGERIQLKDVVKDMSILQSLVEDELNKEWANASYYDELSVILKEYFSDENHDNISFTLDQHGVTFYFNPYDIAPYAAGMQIVTIPYEGNENVLEDSYAGTDLAYGVQLSTEAPFFYDLDEDGDMERIEIFGIPNEDGAYENQKVIVDGQVLNDEVYTYEIDPTFVHTEDGHNYVYIQDKSDNDYQEIYVYNLGSKENPKDTAEKVSFIDAGFHILPMNEEDRFAMEVALTNVTEFQLDSRTELLSTVGGTKSYVVGSDGMPSTDEAFYELSSQMVFTLKNNLLLTKINPDTGKEEGEITVSKGSQVKYVSTDNEKYARLILEDGSLGQVEVHGEVGYRTIDGVNIEDIFDGIIFAG